MSEDFASLAGRVCVVTGALGGIGAASVRELARAGACIVAADLAQDAGPLAGIDAVTYTRCDVTRQDEIEALVATTVERHGRIDVFFGNAGAMASGRAHSVSVEDYRRVMATNVDANFFAVKAAAPVMRRQRAGVFIFTGSTAGLQGMPSSVVYSMAKHALVGLVQSVAVDYGAEGIRAVAIMPGPTRTPMLQEVWRPGGPLEQVIVGTTAVRHLGEPEDQARAVRFLASDDASFITGVAIPVDGGMASGQALLWDLMRTARRTAP